MRYAVGVLGTLVVVLAGFVVALWMRLDALDVRVVGVQAATTTLEEVWINGRRGGLRDLHERVQVLEQR